MANLLDIIFPKYCVNCKKMGDYLCSDCFSYLSFDTNSICLVCGKGSFNGLTHPRCGSKFKIDGSFTGVVFNPISKKMVYQFKYKPYLKNLAGYMADLLYEKLIQDEEFGDVLKKDFLFVPIPLSKKRFKRRGYNQSEVLGLQLSKRFNKKTLNALKRTKETKTMVGLSREKRRENIQNAFELDDKRKGYQRIHCSR